MADDHDLGLLLGHVLAGEAKALDTLLAKVRPYLHLLVRHQLEPGQRHKLGDSDIVQETLLRMHRALDPATPGNAGRFQGRAPPEFLAWVSQIIRNVIVDMQRRGLADKRDERRDRPGSKFFASLTAGSTPEQRAERAEKALLLAAALDRLPPHQREVLEWRILEQLPYSDISARTGKSPGALRVVVTRALETLRADRALRGLLEASS
jgi:RNA polymerase sigma-70 factor (ECF subfamily)